MNGATQPQTIVQLDSRRLLSNRVCTCRSKESSHSNIDTKYMTFVIAAWAVHIEKALNEKQLNDPLKTEFSAALIGNSQENTPDTDDRGKIYNLLKIAGAEHFRFFMLDGFMESAIDYYQKLQTTDLNQILTHLVTQRSHD